MAIILPERRALRYNAGAPVCQAKGVPMIRMSLLGLVLLTGTCRIASAQYPVRYADPCATVLHPAARVPAAESAARPQIRGSAAPTPAGSTRIPSPYVRDCTPSSQAFPAPELILALPRQMVEVQEFRSGVEPSSPGATRYYDTYSLAAEERPVVPAGQPGLRMVRFWNLSERRL